jgi:hypothetical protein
MNTNQKNTHPRFSRWTAFAFLLGALLGFVAGAASMIILNAILIARISYAQ